MRLQQKINNLLNEDNKLILFGILTILSVLWLILYMIPTLFIYLFNSILGNIILLLIVILISANNYKYGILFATIFIIFYQSYHLSLNKEGFQEWNPSSRTEFITIQNTINPGIVFDTKVIENQASQEQVDYFLKYGYWYWNKEVKDLYTDALSKNSFVRTYPDDELRRVQTIYNQNAILDILSSQAKEGQFINRGVTINDTSIKLPSGYGDFGYKSGLTHPMNNVIKCYNGKDTDISELQQITYTGLGGLFNQITKKITPLDYNNLESLIPGFKFINGPCNPCQKSQTHSCPFNLDISGNKIDNDISNSNISPVWKYLWGI